MQALRDAAMRGMHGGSGDRRPAATLGAVGEETLKEFEASHPPPPPSFHIYVVLLCKNRA